MQWAMFPKRLSLGGLFSLPLRGLWGFLRGFILLSKLSAESAQQRHGAPETQVPGPWTLALCLPIAATSAKGLLPRGLRPSIQHLDGHSRPAFSSKRH